MDVFRYYPLLWVLKVLILSYSTTPNQFYSCNCAASSQNKQHRSKAVSALLGTGGNCFHYANLFNCSVCFTVCNLSQFIKVGVSLSHTGTFWWQAKRSCGRPTVSSNMRSPSSPNRNSGQYTADSPDHKFRYIPLRAEDGRPMSARSLDRGVSSICDINIQVTPPLSKDRCIIEGTVLRGQGMRT